MKSQTIDYEQTGDRSRQARYKSQSGWGVFPNEPHAGDVILPTETSLLPSERLVVIPQDFETGMIHTCDFCNSKTYVLERGYVPADYHLIGEDIHDPVAHTCHCCISEAPVDERDALPIEPDDVYIDTWENEA